ncbi:chondroitin sulfate proteoglycan 4 [Pristis pectinata]|uniref:chondroitin sulfate proteoglycan 4 n=1 Tax=Pristis pectinata TaxID=685728 RepID=UPI00223DF5E6|nr:chondroitin sulfate proteoglycan 4 [Pristis pectinata]
MAPRKGSVLLAISSLLRLLYVLLTSIASASGVSFFGDGYVEVREPGSLTFSRLSMKFLTSRRNGILFLAAGRNDYLLMELHAGALQVKLQLGSREVILDSQKGLKLNNLIWHDVYLVHENKALTLTVDGLLTAVEVPDDFNKLQVNFGLYLGGPGDAKTPYLSRTSTMFRGCISRAEFNDHDVLSSLVSHPEYNIEDGCSNVIVAGDNYPANFLGPRSFISLPSWSTKEERRFECFLKTVILQAPLLYHAGWQTNFIALEIADGHLRVLIDNGSGIVVLDNTHFVSDGKWHSVKLIFNTSYVQLIVDDKLFQNQLIDNKVAYLSLQGHLFIGGIDNRTSSELIKRGPSYVLAERTASGSFIGCIHNIRVNSEKKSLADALVTRAINTACKNEENEGMEEGENKLEGMVSRVPTSSFKGSLKNNPPCLITKNMSNIFNDFTRLLDLTPLTVKEAGSSTLELQHIHLTIDLRRIGIRHSQVVFKIIQDGRHGHLELNIPGAKGRKAFTFLDVTRHHVKYHHDGSEGLFDQLIFEVSVHSKQEIPNCLKKGQRYIFNVTITPVNDPPELTFPNGNLITILQNTWKTLGPDVILPIDTDNICAELKIIVINKEDRGYVEDARKPNQRIGEFSCKDLKAGNIRYVHSGAKVSQLLLQVSDGERMSDVTPLRIVAVKPDVQLGKNTGLILPQGGVSLITISNLSVETNAFRQEVDVLYNITEPLHYGEVQKLDSPGKWKSVRTFHQYDIEQGHLRYFSTDPEFRRQDITEKLKFSVTIGQQILENNVFLIKIKSAKITLLRISPNELNNVRRGKITHDELEAAIEGHSIPADLFRYVILKSPDKGKLLVVNEELRAGSTFTQEDLKQVGLTYVATVRNTEETQDSFQFQVFVGDQQSPVYTYPILIGIDPDVPILMSKALVVVEGGTKIITKDQLFTVGQSTTAFVYNITEGPQHGELIIRPGIKEPVTIFTNDDILQQRLMYKHDDSETLEDKIGFVVVEQFKGDGPEADVLHGTMNIYIKPINDQPPVRVVNKTFNVTLNGQHLLTTAELCFHDADSDFDDSKLIYTKWGTSNGNIVSADDTAHELSRFSQEDMEQKRVLFKHHGAQQGKFQLQVSDGVHQTAAVLEVHALDPYLRIVNNSVLLVQQGQESNIHGYFLGVESNVDIRSEEEIVYKVTHPPRHGKILVNGEPDLTFSQKDINNGQVVFHHDNSRHSRDSFNYMVEVKEIKAEGILPILIFMESHRHPPVVVHNEKVFVDQGGAKNVLKEQLLVSHDDSLPSDLIYSVKVPPVYGHLAMATDGWPAAGQRPLKSFSQDDVNGGRVQYVNQRFSPQGDAFTLDVSNGFKSVDGLTIVVDIIPDVISLETQNISVREGGARVLSEDILNISNYLNPLNFKFYITKTPEHGRIGYQRSPEDSLSFFTMKEVKEDAVFYFHDNSETLMDSFTVIVNASEIGRQSEAMTAYVTVIPVNDEHPVVTINTQLEMWEDSNAEISQDLLYTEDLDSPADQLLYFIRPPSNGHVALKSTPSDSILEFTQADINVGQITFVHHGSASGGFHFRVSDGINQTPSQLFTVKARSLNIQIKTEEPLVVYPGTRQPITTRHLTARTNDDSKANNRPIIYTIVTAPALGQLIAVHKENITRDVFSFTEGDLEATNIFYQHDWPKEPLWKCQDSFQFTVSSPPAVTEKHNLTLWISFENHGPGQGTQLWRNKGLKLPQGQSAAIDQSALDASNLLASVPLPVRSTYDVIFEVTAQPVHGFLSLSGERKVRHFTQSDLLSSALEYTHTGSGSLTDSFTFRARLGRRRKPLSWSADDRTAIVISELFNITVVPVKGHPPQIVTMGLTLRALQGSSLVLTHDHMHTVDPDNSPEEIQYSIVTGPDNGFFVHQVNSSTAIKQFTQADINAGKVLFKAAGPPAMSKFHFRVSDGKHSAVGGSVTIEVLPVTVTMVHNKETVLLQGEPAAPITREQLLVDTKGNGIILYKITQQPRHGKVTVNQAVVTEFLQKQIDNGELRYHMTDFSVHQDSFHVWALTHEGNVSGTVNITVQPLVRVARDLQWPRNTTVLIDTDVLDASELGNKTQSTPSFHIIQQPRVGKLIRVHRQNGTQSLLGNNFTQSDLEDRSIAIEVFDSDEAGTYPELDGFQFLLKADGVPPAIAALEFRTVPYIPNQHYNATLLKISSLSSTKSPSSSRSPTAQDGGEMDVYTPTVTWSPFEFGGRGNEPISVSVTTEFQPTASNERALRAAGNNLIAIIIAVILIILLLLVFAIIVIYITKRNKTGKHNVQAPPSKPRNGAVEKETFRKTDHVQSVPLVNIRPLNGTEIQSNSGHVNPEVNQFSQTSNPTVKTNHYWV